MIKLRDYQSKGVDECSFGFRTYKRQILTAPTGAGKTIMFSEIVRRASERNTVTLVLTNRLELFDQTFKSISRSGIAVQKIYKDNKNLYEGALINVAMVETLKRRILKGFKIKPQLIIIDECHIASFNSVIDLYPEANVLGCSATPQGKHIYKYYQNIVSTLDVPELVESDFLCDCKPWQMQDDFSDLEVKAGEYTDNSLMQHFDKPKLYDGVIEHWLKLTPNTKTICFNVNIEHTIKMHNAFLEAGISSEIVTSKTPKEERKRILDAFSSGIFTVLNNCGILTTGYDEPSIETVIMNRATKSLPLFLQCAGRGSRLHPGKKHFTLLDFGMNHNRHGMWNQARTWELKPEKKKKESVAPVKTCGNKECECIVPASTRKCKFCGYVFPLSESVATTGVMVEVKPKPPTHLQGRKISDLNIHELVELETSKAYKASFIWRVLRSHGEDALSFYAKIKGHSDGWVYRQIQDLENNSFTDYKIK